MRSQIIVIASHPRSGTHLLMDFLRLNIPAFKIRLPLWKSTSFLYYDFDNPKTSAKAFEAILASDKPIIIKTHGLDPKSVQDEVAILFPNQPIKTLMPFRPFDRTIASFAAFAGLQSNSGSSQNQNSADLLAQRDLYYTNGQSAVENAKTHGDVWLSQGNAVPVSIPQLLSDPKTAAMALSECLGHPIGPAPVRLPKKKRFQGKAAELYQRFAGRESTEVQINANYRLTDLERSEISAHLDQTYGKLLSRAVNIHSAEGQPSDP